MPTIEAWLLGEDLPSQPGNIAEIPTVPLRTVLRSQLSPQQLTRLAPVQRLVQVVEEVARWIGERFGIEVLAHGHQVVAEKRQPEIPAHTETVKPPRTVREALEQKNAARRRPGIVITPPSDTRRSRGIGV